MKPAIHSAKKVVGNKIETWPLQDDSSPFRPKPDYLRFTRNQSLDPPPSHLSSQGCEKSQTLVHHYLGPGLGNPQTEQAIPQPRPSLHFPLLNGHPDLQIAPNSI